MAYSAVGIQIRTPEEKVQVLQSLVERTEREYAAGNHQDWEDIVGHCCDLIRFYGPKGADIHSLIEGYSQGPVNIVRQAREE